MVSARRKYSISDALATDRVPQCGISLFCACAQQQAGQQEAGGEKQCNHCQGLDRNAHVYKYKGFSRRAQVTARTGRFSDNNGFAPLRSQIMTNHSRNAKEFSLETRN